MSCLAYLVNDKNVISTALNSVKIKKPNDRFGFLKWKQKNYSASVRI